MSLTPESPQLPAHVWNHIPAYGQKIIRNKRINVFYLDTVKIA